MLLVLL